jgi:Ca2+-binding EF-hand superfamily protein
MILKAQSYLLQSALLLLMGASLPFTSFADIKDEKLAVEENDQNGLEQTLEYNFSPEDRARLRKALADYSKSTDPEHRQIELRRKAMKESVEERFNGCDKDNDDSIDREEATLCLPQVARRFGAVDVDEDGVITLEELELAQAKSIERQKAAEAKMEAQKIQEAEAEIKNKSKNKANKQALNTHKRPVQIPSVSSSFSTPDPQ